jgi:hypothetical protein
VAALSFFWPILVGMQSVAERTKRLEALVAATKAWADSRRTELKHRVASNKKILQGRTGAERLAKSTVVAASDLVVAQIDDFLLASK